MNITAIETSYAGCRFRSRIEARWAVFFDRLGIRWEYEPQGYLVNGRPYLPDFRLTDIGTWVEVKGHDDELDKTLMKSAAVELPPAKGPLPTVLLLGSIPTIPVSQRGPGHNWAWIGLHVVTSEPEEEYAYGSHWSFSQRSLAVADTSCATNVDAGGPWIEPTMDMATYPDINKIASAYQAARSARFEHGQTVAQ